MATKGPLVAVIGTTGAGKSRVAIDIALACNGEIINADAMQIYRGLDVITNKVTEQEMKGVKHHLMSFKEPGEESFVTEWLNMALDTIESIHKRQKLPIVVGGTSYWLQNLLFPNRIVTGTAQDVTKCRAEPDSRLQAALDGLEASDLALFQNLPDRPPVATSEAEETFRLWKLLDKLDPEMAARWHWKDSRKVLRNLEIMAGKGKKASEVIRSQDAEPLDSRYRSLVIWPYAVDEVLNPRLDKRVDQMIEGGLLDEIKTLHTVSMNSKEGSTITIDYSSGVYQSIGFKEFHDYVSSASDTAFSNGVESMKRATRKYAKYQTKWIRHKFLPAAHAAPDTYTYVLDTSDAESWEVIEEQAISLTRAFLSRDSLPAPFRLTPLADVLMPTTELSKPSAALSIHKKIACELCSDDPNEPFLVNELEWKAHLNSKGHQRKLKSIRNREINMKYILLKELKNKVADQGVEADQGTQIKLDE